MIPVTQRLKFLVALRPSVTSPTVAARQAATLDRLSNGRALFNLVTGSDPQELAGDGVFLALSSDALNSQFGSSAYSVQMFVRPDDSQTSSAPTLFDLGGKLQLQLARGGSVAYSDVKAVL